MRPLRPLLTIVAVLTFAACGGGDDDEGGGASTDRSPGSTGAIDDPGDDDFPFPSIEPSGITDEMAKIRIANISGVVFDVYGSDTANGDPVLVAEDIADGVVSDYLDVQINPFSGEGELVLFPAGEVPDPADASWRTSRLDGSHTYITVNEVDGPDDRISLVIQQTDDGSQLQWQTLDEDDAATDDGDNVSVFVSYNLFDGLGTVVPAFGVEGEECASTGSTSITQPWPFSAGSTVALVDIQSTSSCVDGESLASMEIEGDAGASTLLVVYVEDGNFEILQAPIG